VSGFVRIIGAGLAGSEAAWQCARRGVLVELFEMRPHVMPPAHHTGDFAELVCSNSFKGTDNARCAGLLKDELKTLGSLVLEAAYAERIPGGTSLIVDRERFSRRITEAITNHPLIDVRRKAVRDLNQLAEPGIPVIVAIGPMTTDEFGDNLAELVGKANLYFFDATSPVLAADSIDRDVVFEASRYGKGGDAGYLNVPLGKEEFIAFHRALLEAEVAPLGHGEEMRLFEGCLPLEEMARRGEDAIRFGPMKPVGLTDPRTGAAPYAVLQLRQEDAMRSAYSIVGFQTRLKYREQERIIRMLPGLENSWFIRHGRMHRNNYIDSPRLLAPTLQMRERLDILFAGQVTGLEGYQAAVMTGLIAGINAARIAGFGSLGDEEHMMNEVPRHTVIGEALRWMSDAGNEDFRPTAPVFGMWKDVPKMRKKERIAWYAKMSKSGIARFNEL